MFDTQSMMKPIRLPEPPGSPPKGVPDIFEGGVYSVIRRAVIIGNGFQSSENQSIGLVRALGLADKHVLYVSSFFSTLLSLPPTPPNIIGTCCFFISIMFRLNLQILVFICYGLLLYEC